MKSWRTTVSGIASILAGLAAIAGMVASGNFNFSDPAWAAAIAGISGGVGLLHARDNKVSSEEVGAR